MLYIPMYMHPLIISGLSSIGSSLLEQTLSKIRNNEHGVINFKAIMQHLSRKGRAHETIFSMKSELLDAINRDPLLNEFRSSPNSPVSVSIDHHGRCLFKENGQTILTCSRDSNLGKLGLAFFNLSQLGIPTLEQSSEVYLENVA